MQELKDWIEINDSFLMKLFVMGRVELAKGTRLRAT